LWKEKESKVGEDDIKPSEKQYAFLFLSRSSFEKKDKDHFKDEIELDYLHPIFKSYVLGRHDILAIFEVEKLSGVGDIISKIYKNYDVNVLNEVVSINCIPYDFEYENRYFCGGSKQWYDIDQEESSKKNIFTALLFHDKKRWKGWISIIFVKLKGKKREANLQEGINYFKDIPANINNKENKKTFLNSIKAFFVGLDVNDFVIVAQNEDPKNLWKITNTIHDYGERTESEIAVDTSTFFLLPEKDGTVEDKQKEGVLCSTLIKLKPGKGVLPHQKLNEFYNALENNDAPEDNVVEKIFPDENSRKKYLETYRQGNYDIILSYKTRFKNMGIITDMFLDFEKNEENFSKMIEDVCTIVRFPYDTGSFLEGDNK